MRTLPERVYFKHGAYYYVTPEKQWIRLGKTEAEALARYASIASSPEVLSTMDKVFDKYLIEVIPQKSPKSQSDNRQQLKQLRPVFGAMRPQDIKPRHVSKYLALRTAKVAANREVALLSHVFKKALNWGIVESNPCLGIERNPEYPRDRYVTDQELNTFLSYAPTWLKLYVELKLLTGLRQADLLKLRCADVTSTGLSTTISKSGRGRRQHGQLRVQFEMTPALRSVLARLEELSKKQGGKLFHVTSSGLDSAWDRTWTRLRKSGLTIQHFTEHDLRAKAASDAASRGWDATALLAHESASTTKAYLRGRQIRTIKPTG